MVPATNISIATRVRLLSIFFVWICAGLVSNAFTQEARPVVTGRQVAVKVNELGNVLNREFSRLWKREDWKFNDWINPLYIINYGTDKEIADREKVIVNSIAFRKFDRNRITLARGGHGDGRKTVVWRVPPGADNPEP